MPAPFTCDMTAIPPEERGAHHALIRRLMTKAVEEIIELENGIAFRFPDSEYDAVSEFVGRERLCCPFLRFALDVAAERGPLHLEVTGPEGVKDFIRAELHLPARPSPSG